MKLNLSYSTLELLHTCPRKFELEKLLQPEGIGESSIDLIAGGALGTGLQELLEGKTFEQAVWETYKKWVWPNGLQNEARLLEESNKKKAFYLVLMHMEKFAMARPQELEGWSLWKLPSGKPAVEVGFRVALPNGSFYRGYIDAILTRSVAGELEFCALEIKSDGMENANQAKYQNSFQGASYALIVDVITGKNNPVQKYFICEFPKLGQQVFDFWKSPADKISWLPSLALDCATVDMYAQTNHFPMRGSSCFAYYRPCKYLGVCNLSRSNNYPELREEDASRYDFNFTLQELLQAKDTLY